MIIPDKCPECGGSWIGSECTMEEEYKFVFGVGSHKTGRKIPGESHMICENEHYIFVGYGVSNKLTFLPEGTPND